MSRKFSFSRPTQRANMITALESLRHTTGGNFAVLMHSPRGTLARLIKVVAAANNLSPSALATIFHGCTDFRRNGTDERSADIETFRQGILSQPDADFAVIAENVFGKITTVSSFDESARYLDTGALRLL